MTGIKVKFKLGYQINAPIIEGIIMDKYIGSFTVLNQLASGMGGSCWEARQNIAVSYYLIKGEDGHTYSIKCSDIIL